MTDDLYLKDLNQYYCTTNHYVHPLFRSIKYTDGVQYLMSNGYSWFVTDAMAVLVAGPRRVRMEPFLVIKLNLRENKPAQMTMDDGNGKIVYRQNYGYTEAKVELKIYFENRVLMLPSER